ncbi:hypothetical protein KSD_04990 [Ktedonobacter sp. SOSP1-85]|uniref:hypothetical protein n=1 Tax=Ktedonobacter sp. SOSP1-85 TaxID=2778367 RepID=UPI00191669E5|nr:hypothetical protein [Ktedonobacter sp. SOSP1-85]GHO72728.1 hypothetical protein KSD_04990 [Ktedonobacter sp. SOSP1-85]
MHCRIRINGHLSSSWGEWFEQLEIVQENAGTTYLYGQLADQAALYSVPLKIRNLGLVLCSLETSEDEGEIL